MPLSSTAIRNAKATDKPQKLADAEGLYLFIGSQDSSSNATDTEE